MKKCFFKILILTGLLCFSYSCNKKDDIEYLRDAFADGIVIDIQSKYPVPDAKVYLMSSTSVFAASRSVDFWDIKDSLITDENGAFHFDFKVSEDIVILGFYIQKEHYFDYKKVLHYSTTEMQKGVKPPLWPKAYLKIRVVDEPPFSGYESMHISTFLTQDAIDITGNPIDTTVIKWQHGYESELMGWFYHNEDGTWVPGYGGIEACPSFDTCYYEIIF